jgi:SAM-dependent methyltransferase
MAIADSGEPRLDPTAISGAGSAGTDHATSPTLDRAQWNARYALHDFIWTTNANRFVVVETGHLAPGIALDLAAGEGRNAVWLAEQGWNVRAVDFSDVALRKAARLADAHSVSARIDFVDADLHTYVPPSRQFDLVLLAYLQLPRQALVPVIQRAADAVAPGGTFLLVGHDAANLEHGFGGPRHPDLLYTAEQVVSALGDALDIEKARRVYRPTRTPDGTQVAVDCLVRAHRPL